MADRLPRMRRVKLEGDRKLTRTRSRVVSAAANVKEKIMGKYFVAWLLGVPAVVLVLLYFFFH